MISKYDLLIDNYVFTHNISPESSLDGNFKYKQRIFDQNSALQYYDTNIGFEFNFNGNTYSRILVLRNGAIVLCASETTAPAIILVRLFSSLSYNNLTINTGTSDLQSDVVLAPWFSEIGYSSHTYPTFATNQEKIDYELGKTRSFPNYFKGSRAGVWIHKNIPNSVNGLSTIIRWNILVSRNPFPSILTSYPVQFECQIFKNGNIKFSYEKLGFEIDNPSRDSKSSIAIYTDQGIRDLSSIVLKQNTPEHKYNGYVVQNGSLPEYALTLENNWPGKRLFNSELLFQRYPDKRTILPTPEIFGKKFKSKFNYFDDRLTKVFGQSERVSFPIGIDRNYGNGTPVSQFLVNNFQKDFELTSFVHKTSDNILNIDDRTPIEYYTDGNNLKSELGHNKLTTIPINLPLHYTTSMPSVSSSVYAYNNNSNAFLMMHPEDCTGPLLRNAPRFNWKPDDTKGFSATGVHLVSSSIFDRLSTTYLLPYKNVVSYGGYIEEVTTNAYPKTLELNNDYINNSNCINLKLPNKEDFFLRRVDIDLKFAFGSDWFNDYTRFQFYSASSPFTSTSTLLNFDSGGPALTVALYRQSSGSLELITKGLITHSNDYNSSVNSIKFVSQSSPNISLFIRERMNFYADPSFIVDASELVGSSLEKTVNLKLEPKTYAGVKFLSYKYCQNYDQIKNDEYIELDFSQDDINYTNEIENGSRDKKGYSASERSTSFETISLSDQHVTENGIKIKNPFYEKILNQDEVNLLHASGSNTKYMLISNLISEKKNDYILRDNDKLVLLISKTRPGIDKFTQQLVGTHTVKMVSNVEIKLIGEYRRGEKQFISSNETVKNNFNGEQMSFSGRDFFDMNDIKHSINNTLVSRYSPSTQPGPRIMRTSVTLFEEE